MKIYVDTLESGEFGNIAFAVSEKGLRYLSFGRYAGLIDILEYACQNGYAVGENRQVTQDVKMQLSEYFVGTRHEFRINLDIEDNPPFLKKVLKETLKIPYGQVLTYGQLAEKVGSPKGVRAIGQAMAKNPIPIVIPCHRVIGSKGDLTGYSAGEGIELKKQLLELEGVLTQGMKAVLSR